MELKHIVGLSGDLSNFVAAILLAWDPMRRKQIFVKKKVDQSMSQNIVLEDEDGNLLPRGEDLEKELVSGESFRSLLGYRLLFLGFSLLILARSLEVWPDWVKHLGAFVVALCGGSRG
jgi:membrane associated rhomboid family serine protease